MYTFCGAYNAHTIYIYIYTHIYIYILCLAAINAYGPKQSLEVAGLIAVDVLAVVLVAIYCWWSAGMASRPLTSRCARQLKKDVYAV